MHYVVQSLANEVPALFLPSAIFGHIRSEGALLLCVASWAGLSFICFSSKQRTQTTMEYYCESLEMNSEGRIIEVVLGTEFSG